MFRLPIYQALLIDFTFDFADEITRYELLCLYIEQLLLMIGVYVYIFYFSLVADSEEFEPEHCEESEISDSDGKLIDVLILTP